jgi:hypothetical protein
MTLSLFSTTALLSFKIYLENVRAPMYKEKVNYDTHRTQTHVCIALILLSSVSFWIAICPLYGPLNTALVSTMIGYGIIFNFLLLCHYTWAQNLVGFVGVTFFLQSYYGVYY